jgi:hypothetical protein
MAVLYKPFSIETGQSPGTLPLEAPSGGGSILVDIDPPPPADTAPPDEVILERDGIHYINSRFMHPGEETEKTLDKKFLDLIDSVINPDSPAAL